MSTDLKPIFSAIQKFTTIDDDGFLSAILFTGGCNFRCHYCYNSQFVIPNKIKYLKINEVINFLKKRKNVIESIVICGGEPTLHKNLIIWLKYIKSLGYRIKLDTNLTNYIMIKKIIDEKLVDYFAIDYKAPLEKYENITLRKINIKRFKETVKLIINSGINYEFRSTIHSDLHSKKDIKKMIHQLKSLRVKRYFLQNFVENQNSIKNLKLNSKTKDIILDLKNNLKINFMESGLRNL